jgi:hypothetical protein
MAKFFLMALLNIFLTQACFANLIYSNESTYSNPVEENNQLCGDFFRVVRPIMPGVNHIFIVLNFQGKHFLYGASKGESDFQYGEEINYTAPAPNYSFVTRKCGSDLYSATERALQISLEWEKKISNQFYFISRMITTPLFGRICHMASQQIIQEIAPN